VLSGGTDVTSPVGINLLHLDTRESEKQLSLPAGNNGLVKFALNVTSVFLKVLWLLHITHYCDGEDFHNLCHIFFLT